MRAKDHITFVKLVTWSCLEPQISPLRSLELDVILGVSKPLLRRIPNWQIGVCLAPLQGVPFKGFGSGSAQGKKAKHPPSRAISCHTTARMCSDESGSKRQSPHLGRSPADLFPVALAPLPCPRSFCFSPMKIISAPPTALHLRIGCVHDIPTTTKLQQEQSR